MVVISHPSPVAFTQLCWGGAILHHVSLRPYSRSLRRQPSNAKSLLKPHPLSQRRKMQFLPKGVAEPNSRGGGKPQPPLDALQNHFSAITNHISASLAGPAAAFASLKSRFDSAVEGLCKQGRRSFLLGASRFAAPVSSSSSSSWQGRSPGWARIPRPYLDGWAEAAPMAQHGFDIAMSTESMEERLAGVPVYALSNSAQEFVLVSGVDTGKSLGLFCFRREDAETLLEQMKSMNPGMRQGSKVVAVALNKVFQLKVDGVAFRFIPDSCQIRNAIKVQEQVGESIEGFSGVPVFQSKSLVLKSQNKRYRPVFFRKEDLEESLHRASQQQNYLNPALRKGDIQVSVLEEMIAAMKGSSASKWDDVVFIPPGFNIGLGLQEQPIATG